MFLKSLIACVFLLSSDFSVYAQDTGLQATDPKSENPPQTLIEPTAESVAPLIVQPTVPQVVQPVDSDLNSAESSAVQSSTAKNFSILVDLAPLSMWVPYKIGATVAWKFQPQWALEFTGLRGQMDLSDSDVNDVGDASELRYDLTVRKYFGSHFSIFAGYSYQTIKAEVGDDVRAQNTLPFYDTEIKTHGLIAGIGNRWMSDSGFTFGIDWASVIVPFSCSVENDFRTISANFSITEDAENVKDAIDKIEKTPRLTLLHFRMGWTF